MATSHLFPTPRPAHPFHLVVPKLHPFLINGWCSKSCFWVLWANQSNSRRRSWESLIARWPEVQVITWTCDWHSKLEGVVGTSNLETVGSQLTPWACNWCLKSGRGQSCRTEPVESDAISGYIISEQRGMIGHPTGVWRHPLPLVGRGNCPLQRWNRVLKPKRLWHSLKL